MDEDTIQLIFTMITTLIGSGIATTLVNIYFQRRNARELEIYRATLSRGSRLHEEQVKIMSALFSLLWKADYFTKRSCSPALFVGEDREILRRESIKAFNEAAIYFYEKQILVPEEICSSIEEFLKKSNIHTYFKIMR